MNSNFIGSEAGDTQSVQLYVDFISSVNLGKTKVMVSQYTKDQAVGIGFHLWTGDGVCC